MTRPFPLKIKTAQVLVAILVSLSSYLHAAVSIAPGALSERANPTLVLFGTQAEVEMATYQRRDDLDGAWVSLSIDDYELQSEGVDQWRLVDKSVRLSAAQPVEYEYRTLEQANAGDTGAWTSSCTTYDENVAPLEKWSNRVDEYPFHFGSATVDFSAAPSCSDDLSSDPDQFCMPEASYETQYYGFESNLFHMLSNDKYIAVFSGRGGLLALTHRTHGMEFQNALRNNAIAAMTVNYNCDPQTGICADKAFQSIPNSVTFDSINDELVFAYDLPNTTPTTTVTARFGLRSTQQPGMYSRLEISNGDVQFRDAVFPNAIGLGFVPDCINGDDSTCFTAFVPGKMSGEAKLMRSAFSGTYQASSLSAQFSIVSTPADQPSPASLLIAALDPEGYPKQIKFDPTNALLTQGGSRNNGFAHYLQDGYQISAAQSFEILMRPTCGDWTTPAKIYRKWSENQEWTPGKLKDRNDVPAPLLQSRFWLTANNGIDSTLQFKKDYLENIMLPLLRDVDPLGLLHLGVHDYNWHRPGFDHGFPVYEPKCLDGSTTCTSSDWVSYLSSLQSDSQTVVMPYINGALLDISNELEPVDPGDPGGAQQVKYCPSVPLCTDPLNNHSGCAAPQFGVWGQAFSELAGEVLSDYTVKQFSGDPVSASYSSQQCFGIMQLSAAPWQQKIAQLALQSLSSGAAGQYLDSFGGGYRADYGTNTGYQAGHSQWHKEGVRETVDEIWLASSGVSGIDDRFVASEHYSELNLRYIDLHTMYTEQPPSLTPLLSSVYSGYHSVAGMQLRTLDAPLARRYRLSLPFLWGFQPGLASYAQLTGSNTVGCISNTPSCDYDSVVYAYRLAKSRENMTDILALGEFVQPVGAAGSSGTQLVGQWCADQSCNTSHQPSFELIPAAHWQDSAGNDWLIITNPNSVPTTMDIELPGELKGRALTCQDGTGAALACISNYDGDALSLNLPALQPAKISVTVWTDTDGDLIDNFFDPDDDGDGMPDNWEIAFDLDPLSATDANEDPDGDGFDNLTEFNQGTHPLMNDNEFSVPIGAAPHIALFSLLLILGVLSTKRRGMLVVSNLRHF